MCAGKGSPLPQSLVMQNLILKVTPWCLFSEGNSCVMCVKSENEIYFVATLQVTDSMNSENVNVI